MLSRRLQRAEDGSVIIAVTVILVVTLLMVTTLTSLYSGLNAARNDQNRTNAFQLANAGMDEAVHRLDRKLVSTTATAGYTPIIVGGELVGFQQTVTVGTGAAASDFVVQAMKDPPGQDTVWRVTSTGKDASGRERRAIATVAATPIFVNGFVTLQNFLLTGNQDFPVAYDSKVCPQAFLSCNILPVPSRLASNATIDGADATIEHFKLNWQGFEMYGRPTQSTADFACAEYRCGTSPKVLAQTNSYKVEQPDVSEFTQSCPGGGNIGTSSTSITTIEPGSYLCNSLNIQGTVIVGSVGNGTGQVRIWVAGSFGVASGAVVNRQKPTPKFQVYQDNAASAPGGGSICGAEIWGLLNTPKLPVACNGSAQPKMYGAVIAQLHGGTGNHFDFHYDLQSKFAVHNGKYVIKNWRECPAGVADC